MATTVNGGTRIAIDVATAVSRCPEYHLLVDVGLRRSSPSTEHLSPLIAARSHASTHACTNGTHSGSSLLASRVVFPSFLLASRSHLVTRGIRANEVPPFSLFYLPLSFCYLSFSRLARQWLNTNYTIYTTNNRRKRKVIFFFMFGYFTRRALLPLVVYAAQGKPPFSYCTDRPGLLSLLANRKRGFARQGKKQQRTKWFTDNSMNGSISRESRGTNSLTSSFSLLT